MTILICGVDGYLGWPLAMHLAATTDEEIVGIDNLNRRRWVEEVGSWSATPIATMEERQQAFQQGFLGKSIEFLYGDLTNYHFVSYVLKKHQPHTIVHFAEQPSAPFSMIDINHAVLTQTNNIVSTLNLLYGIHHKVPNCHLVKMGSMGEYGWPSLTIPEGYFELEYKGKKQKMPFPRQAEDWYHASKIYDSTNIELACRVWNLRCTDIMQGVVFGIRTPEMDHNDKLLTRFDFDAIFGTVINRFCAQAVIGHTLTTYGKGGQVRPFISLQDAIKCLSLIIENPANQSEYRVINQIDQTYTINELAEMIATIAKKLGLEATITATENPRVEIEEKRFYEVEHEKLKSLGFNPSNSMDEEIEAVLRTLLKFKERVSAKKEVILPKVRWRY